MGEQWKQELKEEETGINIHNEGSLHSQIKQWYGEVEDRFEVKVGRYIIDIVRNDELIEIQTKNFGAIKNKLKKLTAKYPVRLVYPIWEEKWIRTINIDGEVIRRRKSPKRGTVLDLFDELIRCPELMNERLFSLEILLIKGEEIRCQDGRGSWRRNGISIHDRILLNVTERKVFKTKEDFLSLFPKKLPQPFTNKIVANHLLIPTYKATRMTYCLKKMDLIEPVGKKGNALLYQVKHNSR